MVLVQRFFVLPAVTTALTVIAGNPALLDLCGCVDADELPSRDSVYRFLKKLRRHQWLEECTRSVQAAIRGLDPSYGQVAAGDSTDIPAYANGQRLVRQHGPARLRFADPDASWGHRGSVSTRKGGGFFGYKIDSFVCAKLELPLGLVTRTASESELPQIPRLFDLNVERGFSPTTIVLDRGYDVGPVYDECHQRHMRLVCPLKSGDKQRDGHRVPICRHGRREYRWIYAGTDMKRGHFGATKWRCPVGKCRPRSMWISLDRFHPAIPRETRRSHVIYDQRTAVERFWGRLKQEWGLLDLRVRRLDRVSQHVDLVVLAYLLFGLARLRGGP